MKVRTRFAPSPTGFLHVGGIRTALFAWLVARQNNGKFILRLEDTDQKREQKGSDKHIVSSLQALGLDYDEGPDIGGNYGPYRQSERLEIYKQWASKLIARGRAYADPYTPVQVQNFREVAQKNRKPFLYRHHRPDSPPDWDERMPLRFKSEPKDYRWQDEVMGSLSASTDVIDDFIIIKSDGFPTYNFAHIVDDAEMKISHIIRGQEFLASMPNYLNLYEALGLDHPTFVTLPHVLNEQGNKKLSKRDGAKDILEYIKDGFLPEALRSFIATLGWNDGSVQEVFSTTELIKKFSLKRVGRSGAHFDKRRLNWVNGSFIRSMSANELYERVTDYWPAEASDYDSDYKLEVLKTVQERLKFFAELPELTIFFFKELPIDKKLISGHKQLKKVNKDDLRLLLEATNASLSESDFSMSDITNRLNDLLELTNTKPTVLFSLIRIAITQVPASPGLAETLHVLGKQVSIARVGRQIEALGG